MRLTRCSLVFGLVSATVGCERPDASTDSKAKPVAPGAPAASVAAAPSTSAAVTTPTPAPTNTPPAPPTPNTLRLVVLHDSELFTSEKSQITALEKHIEKDGPSVNAIPATDDERAYAKSFVAKPDAPGALPAAWSQFETVVLLQIEPPRDSGAQKGSGGRSLLSILHPPNAVPAFSSVYAEKGAPGAPSIDGARLGVWIRNHLTFRKATP